MVSELTTPLIEIASQQSDTMAALNLPPSGKMCLPFLKQAGDFEKRDPTISYDRMCASLFPSAPPSVAAEMSVLHG